MLARMAWSVTCACGARINAATQDELVAAMERHVAFAHAAVGTAPARDDLMAMAVESDDP
jgi:hypothetical protein